MSYEEIMASLEGGEAAAWERFLDFCEEQYQGNEIKIPDGEMAYLFAQWLANETGQPVVGRKLDDSGELAVAVPQETR